MTSVRERRTHTIEVFGTALEVRTALEALRRNDQMVGPPRLEDGRLLVDVKVRARPRERVLQRMPPLRWRRWASLYASVIGSVGATGHVLAASGALDALVRVAEGIGGVGALAFLAYAVVTVQHKRHCPGCGHH